MTDAGQSADLAVVMPVYNEEGCIAAVVGDWQRVLERLPLAYRLLVLDDGSRDRTPAILDSLPASPALVVVHKPNSGHGPTILQGYALAVAQAAWVFQCDSDNEIGAAHFPPFWDARETADAIFGVRTGRQSNWDRRLISATSRLAVRLVCGGGVQDVNVPYRLIRAPLLATIVRQIPPDTFAPNVIIAGAIARAGLRIANLPVPLRPPAHRQRLHPEVGPLACRRPRRLADAVLSPRRGAAGLSRRPAGQPVLGTPGCHAPVTHPPARERPSPGVPLPLPT